MEKQCVLCYSPFIVSEADLSFYDRVSPRYGGVTYQVPPPSHCPQCRQQRRLVWRNELHLYRRSCDLCNSSIVSVHPQDSPFPVYCLTCWWGDRWNAIDYGMDFDSTRPFLEQLAELQRRVPRLAIQNDNGIGSENSEYCYDISRAKNCYRVIGSWYIEECLYGLNVNRSKFVVDCNTVSINSELVYESLDSQRLYHCAYLQNCEGCNNCFFGYDLKGCSDCWCCYGLRNKRFYIYNQPYTEAEYRAKVGALNLGSYQEVARIRQEYDAWALKRPRRAANIQNCEDSVGNNLFNCKQVLGYSAFNAEYSKFIDRSDGPKNCYDMINTGGPEWCYDSVTPDDSYLVLFSVFCWKSKHTLYSDNCHSSEHLLGCVSMRRNQYCILNRQYSKQDYEKLAPVVIASLRQEQAWGEHLPVALSPFAYNESAAFEYYPLTREQVMQKGWRWSDNLPSSSGKETVSWDQLPDQISAVDDDITKHVLACESCAKNYKIMPSELAFYRKMPAPLPRSCPLCRHAARFARKTKTNLWTRSCTRCGQEIQTAYSPSGPEIVYCDACYFAQVD